eukprot:Nk52_evm18s2578 gene=Nk52_evmTU18s2578
MVESRVESHELLNRLLYYLRRRKNKRKILHLLHTEGFQDLTMNKLYKMVNAHFPMHQPTHVNKVVPEHELNAILRTFLPLHKNVGYREITSILLRRDMNFPEHRVRNQWTALRKSMSYPVEMGNRTVCERRKFFTRGPNHLWCMDGHDKLKPSGFSIHGCVDACSRRLLWLKVCINNKSPQAILRFYLQAVQELEVVPSELYMDHSQENVMAAGINDFLARQSEDELPFFRYTKSTHNVRIERFWLTLRRQVVDVWKELVFDQLSRDQLIDLHCPLSMNLLHILFNEPIQTQLDEYKEMHNNHELQRKGKGVPNIVPDDVYFNRDDPEGHLQRFGHQGIRVDPQRFSAVLRQFRTDLPITAGVYRSFHDWATRALSEKYPEGITVSVDNNGADVYRRD